MWTRSSFFEGLEGLQRPKTLVPGVLAVLGVLWHSYNVLPSLLVLSLLASGIPVDGRVRDTAGVGLAGARVELRPILSYHEQGLRDFQGRPVEPAARTVTGPDGRFELLAPETGMWEVTVSTAGFVSQRFRLVPLTEALSLPPVELRRDAGLRVRVESPDGRPLPGARVSGRSWQDEAVDRNSLYPPQENEDRLSEWQTVPREATAGADGVARLPCSRDELLWLFATAPGFPVQEGPQARGPADRTIRLRAGTPRRIDVRGADGALLRDLRTSFVVGRTRNGRAEVIALPDDEPWLALETADGASLRFAARDKTRVTVPAPMPLPGRVIEALNRQPLPGAWIWPLGDPGRAVRSGADGGYRLHAAPSPGLEAAAAGFFSEVANRKVPWPAAGLPTLALYPTAPSEDAVEPGGGGAVVGRIADPDGSPVLEGEVEIRSGELKLGPAGLGAGGGFAFADVPPGWYEILVRRPGALAQRLPRFQVPESGGETDLGSLTLRPVDLLAGRLETPDGKPVAGAEVWAESLSWGDPVRDAWPAAVSGPDGSFTLRASAWEEIELTVCRPGLLPIREELPRFFPEETLALTLRPAAVLAGRITGPDGSPIAGALALPRLLGSAASVPGCSGTHWWRADGAGRFRIDSLTPGFYDVHGQRLTLRAGETREAAIRYEDSGPAKTVLTGRLLDEAGAPLPGTLIRVEVHKPEGSSYTSWYDSARTDGDGNYRFEFSDPEVSIDSYGLAFYEVPAILVGFEPWPGPGILRGKVTYDLTAIQRSRPAEPSHSRRLDPIGGSVTLAGRILGLASEALPRTTLMASQTGADIIAGSVDARGTYRLDGLEPGEWRIQLNAESVRIFETVSIPAGETRVDRDLVVGRLVEANGVVEDNDHRQTVAGANVSFRHFAVPFDYRLPVVRTRSRKDGSFSIRVPGGQYEITATRPGFLTPAWVTPGMTDTVEGMEAVHNNLQAFLERTARVSGALRGLPVDENDLEIEATREDQERYQEPIAGKMDTEDTYSIAGLGPGTWHLEAVYDAESGSKRRATGRVQVAADTTEATVDLDFQPGDHTLSGRVTGTDPSDYFWAEVQPREGGLIVTSGRVHDNAFRIDHLRAGTYRVRLMTYDTIRKYEALAETEVTLPLDGELTIEVER